jgi:hypothetical protein
VNFEVVKSKVVKGIEEKSMKTRFLMLSAGRSGEIHGNPQVMVEQGA